MSFNESNTVEQMILDAVENLGRTAAAEPMPDAPGWGAWPHLPCDSKSGFDRI